MAQGRAAMTIQLTYECPGTDDHPPHRFRYMHHPSIEDDPLPRFCGICGYDSMEGFDKAIVAPHIAKSIGKAVDGTYRQMEAQSEDRMHAAAEMTGGDISEFSDLKITNLQDNLREGDIAAVPVVNEVTKAIDANPGLFGHTAGTVPDALGNTPQQYAAATTTGPNAYAGAKTRTMLNQFHTQNHREMNRRAEIGTHTG